MHTYVYIDIPTFYNSNTVVISYSFLKVLMTTSSILFRPCEEKTARNLPVVDLR
jgi:hypothetical protein